MTGFMLQNPSVNTNVLWLRGMPVSNASANLLDLNVPGFNDLDLIHQREKPDKSFHLLLLILRWVVQVVV